MKYFANYFKLYNCTKQRYTYSAALSTIFQQFCTVPKENNFVKFLFKAFMKVSKNIFVEQILETYRSIHLYMQRKGKK